MIIEIYVPTIIIMHSFSLHHSPLASLEEFGWKLVMLPMDDAFPRRRGFLLNPSVRTPFPPSPPNRFFPHPLCVCVSPLLVYKISMFVQDERRFPSQ